MRELDYEPDYGEDVDESILRQGPSNRKSSRKSRRMMKARRAIEEHFERKELEDNVREVWYDED